MELASVCGALVAAVVVGGWTPEKMRVTGAGDRFFVKEDSKQGHLFCMARSIYCGKDSKAKVTLEDGWLVVDTTEVDYGAPRCWYEVSFPLPVEELPGGRDLELSVRMKGTAGAVASCGHNGHTVDKKHYWNVRDFTVEGGEQAVVYRHKIPSDLKTLQYNIRLRSPGIYRFGEVSWQEVLATNAATYEPPTKNLLANGGAERGWYGTQIANLVTYSENGWYDCHDGQTYRTPLEVALDTEERHSGKCAFRLTARHDGAKMAPFAHYNMEFNQVPFVKGKPLTWSVWLKTDKPGTEVWMRVNVSGSYVKKVRPTAEWTRYSFTIPAVGERVAKNGNGEFDYGGLAQYYDYATPRLDILNPCTLWVDDAAICQATEATYAAPKLDFTGVLSKPGQTYCVGEPITARLKLSAPAKVSSKAYDFRGNVVATTDEKMIPAGESELTLELTAAQRGAVRWVIRANDEEIGFLLGVIGPRKPPARRFGYNIGKHVNMPWIVDMMKDFRIGAARVWDSYNKPERSISVVDTLHRAGIDVLYCFADAGAHLNFAQRYLVEKDPTDWQEHIADIVTNCLGKVAVWEILNEPNARSGMGKNPDPEKYELLTTESNVRIIANAAKAIRAYDRTTPIGGPTTCHTDLSWTLDVLNRGAWKDLDVITEHPYCSLPEVPDYAKQVKTLITEASRLKGKPVPCLASERGKVTPSGPRDGAILENDINGAAKIVRTMIVGYAGGSSCFYDFTLSTGNYALSYVSVHTGNPDNGYRPKASALLYAERALMDLIEDAPVVKELKVGAVSRAYVFDRGKKRVVALWKFQGEPREVKLGRPFAVCDFMGTLRTLDTFTLDGYPQYLVTEMTADELEALFARLDFGVDEVKKAEVRPQTKVPYFEKDVDWSKAAKIGAADGPNGEKMDVRFAWNRSGLRMRVVVAKKGFHPEENILTSLWQGDSIQVAFDPLKNAEKSVPGYDDDDFEYDLALFKGEPTVYRRHASLATHDSLHKPLGKVEDVQLTVTPGETETVYEANFAPQAVSPFRLGIGESMRLSVGTNISDGTKRYATLALTPGLVTPQKHPYDFTEIVLGE